mmetsp:Transcript_4393/g.590  ORF Transcript_4393/g.590 Transcript_4393/m.590 type:complete len:174 (+) Transcript_4393:233-754(+)
MGGFYGAFGFALMLIQSICLTFNFEYLFQYKTPSISIKYWEFVVNLSSYNTSISVITAFTILLLPSLLGQMGTLPAFPIPHTLSAFTHCLLTTLELSLPNYNDSIKKIRVIQYYMITKIPIIVCIAEMLLAINFAGNVTADMAVITIVLIVNQLAKLPFVIEVRRVRPTSPVF